MKHGKNPTQTHFINIYTPYSYEYLLKTQMSCNSIIVVLVLLFRTRYSFPLAFRFSNTTNFFFESNRWVEIVSVNGSVIC
jgi:hypothetical protein